MRLFVSVLTAKIHLQSSDLVFMFVLVPRLFVFVLTRT
jgi:hypothetical protein